MKRLFSILLCLVMCFGWSLTAFAGGPIPAQDILAAESTDSAAAVTAQTALPSGLSVGTTYSLVSMASELYALNVYSGSDTDGAKVDMWEWDGSKEQRFRLISSGSYYKLEAICSSSGRVLDAYRPLTNGCKADLWSNNDDEAQRLVITGDNISGYVICLAYDQTLALTAAGLSNDGAVQFKTYNSNASNQKWMFIKSDATLKRTPHYNAQNKKQWCWAAAAKMVGVHNGGLNPNIDTAPQKLNDKDGVKDPFYGYNNNMTEYYADGVQYAILVNRKDDKGAVVNTDSNVSGTDSQSVDALQYVSANNMEVGHYGKFTVELPQSEIDKINKELIEGRFVIGSMTSRESAAAGVAATAYGHSVVIQKYYPGTNGQEGKYDVFDPLTGKQNRYYQSELFGNDFGYRSENRDCRISWYKWCR